MPPGLSYAHDFAQQCGCVRGRQLVQHEVEENEIEVIVRIVEVFEILLRQEETKPMLESALMRDLQTGCRQIDTVTLRLRIALLPRDERSAMPSAPIEYAFVAAIG